jgi:hypothetical protein
MTKLKNKFQTNYLQIYNMTTTTKSKTERYITDNQVIDVTPDDIRAMK